MIADLRSSAKETLKFDSKTFRKVLPGIWRKYQVTTPGYLRFIIRSVPRHLRG